MKSEFNLKTYYGKKVSVIASHGEVIKGIVAYYFPPEENESNKESIAFNNPFLELYAKDIKSIKIIK